MRRFIPTLLAALTACGPLPPLDDGGALEPDAAMVDAGRFDAGSSDAGQADAGLDAGGADAGQPDAGVMGDAGTPVDAGLIDAGMFTDAGALIDAGVLRDAGVLTDAGPPTDAGLPPDAGTATDAGVLPDAGAVDAGQVDAGPLPDAGAQCGLCANYGSVMNLGVISLREISGLAVSRKNAGILYGHEDSGAQAVVTVIGANGASLGAIVFVGATNIDWEDMALGPCPAGSCLYVGEIGDNAAASTMPYAVYRVPEPTFTPGQPIGMMMLAAERFELQYTGGMKSDAETLLVHPTSGDIYVVTKHQSGTRSSAWKATAPLSPTMPNVMTRVAMLAVPAGTDLPITGGDIDPCGVALLLRSYSALYQFVLPSNATSFDAIFTAPFTRVPVSPFPAGEPQGEAVAWAPGGGYYTASEVSPIGLPQQLHFVGCR